MKLERRLIETEDLELRVESGEKAKRLTGYGIVYNKRSQLLGGMFYEIIRPGAARKILEGNPDVKCALNHNTDHIFGRTKNGTLILEENQQGVKYNVEPPDTQWARDAIVSIERRDIDGSSFTFSVGKDGEKWTEQKDGTLLREIFEFERIGEMGPVTEPAYLDTTTNMRSLEETFESYADQMRAQEESLKIAEAKRALCDRRIDEI